MRILIEYRVIAAKLNLQNYSPIHSPTNFPYITFLLALFFSLVMMACKSNQNETKTLLHSGGTFKLLLSDPVERLDPINIMYDSDWHISALIYEGLVTYGEKSGDIKPLIAESWQILNEGKRYIFKIRSGIKFHNDPCFINGKGRELKIEDIIKNFERIADPKSDNISWALFRGKIEGINDFHLAKTKTISGIKIIDGENLEINLTKPYVSFLLCLASPSAFIVPPEAIEYYGSDFEKHPVGTGPFRLALWKPLEEMLLVKNEIYWDKSKDGQQLPLLDEIYVRFLANSSIALSDFLKEENFLYLVNENVFQKLKSEKYFFDKYNYEKIDYGFSLRFFGFSLDKGSPLVKDVNFRRALAVNIKLESITIDSLNNFVIARSLVPPKMFGDSTLTFGKHNFKSLEDSSIFIDQIKKYKIDILSTIYSKEIKCLENSLAELGVKYSTNIQTLKYYEQIEKDRPDIFRVGMLPSYPDPEEYYNLFHSKNINSVNLTHYNNPEYDRVLEKAMFEQNKTVRLKYFLQLEEILKEDVPAIYISHEGPRYYLYPKFVRGLKIQYMIPNYKCVWLERKDAKTN
ncbi:MAG: ABC transporter substrate-binding protein [Ignavibacteriales bacterium]|nr:ABC transporter substrate-binding protein [Ignavibacteriales bacterium]